jgi:hypothetical protein
MQTLAQSELKRGVALASRIVAAGACLAAFLGTVNDLSAEQSAGEVKAQGGWAYTTRESEGGVEYMATMQAEEGATWLLLACGPDKRLTVSLIHVEQFPFPLTSSSPVQLRSNHVPSFTVQGKSIQSNLIFVDPRPLRQVMPLIVQDDQLVVSISEQNGTFHDYTFSMQPNDTALGPIRSGCFGY